MQSSDGLITAAASGDRGSALRALRAVLAREIEVCASPRDLAALSRQLTDVLRQIDDLPRKEEGTALDELNARRAARGAVTSGASRSSRGR